MDLFGTAGIRGSVTETVTPAVTLRVGRAIAATAPGQSEFVVGCDGRLTSPGLVKALTAGLTSGGADVVDIGQTPTPALAYASQSRRGVMITASHNPPTDNGIKVMVDGTEYGENAEQAIETAYEDDPPPVAWDQWGTTGTEDILPAYRQAVTQYVTEHAGSLTDTTVVVDCGSGVGGLVTPDVLRMLDAEPIALNANVDGTFPARSSKPTEQSLEQTRAFVERADVDLGLAHDGDADRTVVIGPTGEIIHEDTILAVLAEHYVRESDVADPVVVTTPNASDRVDERVAAAGGRIERTALGTLHEGIDRIEGDAGDETAVVFAGEPWKHLHPVFGGWIDGVVSAGLIAGLTKAAGGIEALTDPVTERPYRKVNVSCPDGKKEPAMKQIIEQLPETFPEADATEEYGLRLSFPGRSWVLIRPSGTEPYLRVYAESENVDRLVETVREEVEAIVAAA